MARLEYDEIELGPCPCGKGKSMRRIASMDHGYGAGSPTDYLDCPECEVKERKKQEEVMAAWKAAKKPT